MFLKKMIPLLFGVLAFGCSNSAPTSDWLGPTPIEITVSGGVHPTISWKGGPVMYVTVATCDSQTSLNLQRQLPMVWGYKTVDDSGKGINGIVSPVQLGSVIPHAVDVSDSAYRTDTMIPGKLYIIRMATWGPKDFGYTYYTPQE